MARYLERAEHTAKLIDVQLNLMLDQTAITADRRWGRVLASLGAELPKEGAADTYSVVRMLVVDHGKRSSIVSCIMQARENARQVREQISNEMWEQLNRVFHETRRAAIDEMSDANPLAFLEAVREGAYLFQGITDSTMSHGEGWQFIQIGKFLERAQSVSKLLDVHFSEFYRLNDGSHEAADHLEWIGLLRSCMAFEAYCKNYTADVSPDRVAEFLLLNPEFPHSVRFAVDVIQASLNALPEATSSRKGGRVSRLAGRLRASLSFTQIEEIMGQGIHTYLESIQRQCGQIHASAYQGYIDYPIESALLA
jgi:uncharacterized alpha-E superfamily protein